MLRARAQPSSMQTLGSCFNLFELSSGVTVMAEKSHEAKMKRLPERCNPFGNGELEGFGSMRCHAQQDAMGQDECMGQVVQSRVPLLRQLLFVP